MLFSTGEIVTVRVRCDSHHARISISIEKLAWKRNKRGIMQKISIILDQNDFAAMLSLAYR